MKKYLILIPVLMFLLTTNLWATIISDIEYFNDGLYATSPWNVAPPSGYTEPPSPDAAYSYLYWSVTSPDDQSNQYPGRYVYTYTFHTGSGGANQISHMIIQASTTFARGDLLSGTTQLGEGEEGSAGEIYPIVENFSVGQANPGLPGPIRGVKWQDPDTANDDAWTLTIVTYRVPMEGMFYAVDGKGQNPTYAYSTPTDVGGNPVLVPNTTVIPEPATMLLFGGGLIGVAAVIRRRFKK